MKRIKIFFRPEEKSIGDEFWNGVFFQPLGEKIISIEDEYYDITPDIQAYFTNTKLTTIFLDIVEKESVFDILENFRFYDNKPKIGLKSARMRDALYILPKTIAKIRNYPFPTIENVENSTDLQGQGIEKITIPSNIIDIYTKIEILLGLKFTGLTDTLREASTLLDDLFKKGKIQNKQQNRNALNRFHTQ